MANVFCSELTEFDSTLTQFDLFLKISLTLVSMPCMPDMTPTSLAAAVVPVKPIVRNRVANSEMVLALKG